MSQGGARGRGAGTVGGGGRGGGRGEGGQGPRRGVVTSSARRPGLPPPPPPAPATAGAGPARDVMAGYHPRMRGRRDDGPPRGGAKLGPLLASQGPAARGHVTYGPAFPPQPHRAYDRPAPDLPFGADLANGHTSEGSSGEASSDMIRAVHGLPLDDTPALEQHLIKIRGDIAQLRAVRWFCQGSPAPCHLCWAWFL